MISSDTRRRLRQRTAGAWKNLGHVSRHRPSTAQLRRVLTMRDEPREVRNYAYTILLYRKHNQYAR